MNSFSAILSNNKIADVSNNKVVYTTTNKYFSFTQHNKTELSLLYNQITASPESDDFDHDQESNDCSENATFKSFIETKTSFLDLKSNLNLLFSRPFYNKPLFILLRVFKI